MWRARRVAALGASAAVLSPTFVSPAVRCNSGEDSGVPASAWAAGAAVAAGAAACWWFSASSESANSKEWNDRWQGYKEQGIQPGFHKSDVNPRLEEHYLTLFGDKQVSRSVLVPMAGKTVDLDYLAKKGHQVLGVEIVQQAVDEYLVESPLRCLERKGSAGCFKLYQSKQFLEWTAAADGEDPQPIFPGYKLATAERGTGLYKDAGQGQVTMACGDFMQLESAQFGQFEAAYDRGSLVAIDPSLRTQYGEVLKGAIKAGGRVMLVVVEHPPMKGGKLGPPYSIDPAEVERVFGGAFEINEVERWEVNEEEGWQKRMGTEWFNEVLYVLHRKLD